MMFTFSQPDLKAAKKQRSNIFISTFLQFRKTIMNKK